MFWGLAAAAILAFLPLAVPQGVSAAFAGENGKIAYESNINAPANDSSVFDIYVVNPDGSGQARLTTAGGADPAWSPDGTKIVFDSMRDGNSEIYVMNADGTGQTRLTNRGATDIYPSWSPDGSKIVFASYDCCGPGANYDIWVMHADGTDLVNLTNNPAEDIFPVWQPGGSKIAFQTNRDGNTEIYAMNVDASGLLNLTNDTAEDSYPDWSPDGSKIAFNSDRAAPYTTDIYVMNADGGGVTRVTSTTHDFGAAWSPDGSKIVFTSSRDFNDEIYVMNADGSNATRLTNNAPPGNTFPEDWFPDWQRGRGFGARQLPPPPPPSSAPRPPVPGFAPPTGSRELPPNLGQRFNDDFARARVVTSLPFTDTVDITYATIEPGEPQSDPGHEQRSVWWSFTPVADTVVTTAGPVVPPDPSQPPSLCDLRLSGFFAVYRADGPGFAGLAQLAFQGSLHIQAGKTYYIQAGQTYYGYGISSCPATYTLYLSSIAPPPNDDFGNAIAFNSVPFSDSEDLTAATLEPDEPTGCGASFNGSAWYAFTPTISGSYGSPDPGVNGVNVYAGGSLSDLIAVACSDWFGVQFWAEAGTTYYLQYYGGGMRIDSLPPPAADFRYSPSHPSTLDDVSLEYWNGGYWDPTVNGWAWDFGDGTTATGQSVSHRFAADGDYAVTLTVSARGGRTASQTQTVSVHTYGVMTNDDWDTATPITGVPFQVTQETLLATTAPDDELFFDEKTVWFSFTPGESMRVAISTEGSDYPTDVAVYTGPRDNRGHVSCEYAPDGVQRCNVDAGTTYHIVVSARYGDGGLLEFSVLPGGDGTAPVVAAIPVPAAGTSTAAPTDTFVYIAPSPRAPPPAPPPPAPRPLAPMPPSTEGPRQPPPGQP